MWYSQIRFYFELGTLAPAISWFPFNFQIKQQRTKTCLIIHADSYKQVVFFFYKNQILTEV